MERDWLALRDENERVRQACFRLGSRLPGLRRRMEQDCFNSLALEAVERLGANPLPEPLKKALMEASQLIVKELCVTATYGALPGEPPRPDSSAWKSASGATNAAGEHRCCGMSPSEPGCGSVESAGERSAFDTDWDEGRRMDRKDYEGGPCYDV